MTDELKRYFFPLDPNLPDEERVRLVEEYDKSVYDDLWERNIEGDVPPHPEDVVAWRGYTQDTYAEVRALGVGLLCEHGPLDWSDLEAWAIDPNKTVRNNTVWAMRDNWYEAGKLCDSDRPRCVSLLSRVAEDFNDYYGTGMAMLTLAQQNQEWLELTWSAAEGLLNPDRPLLNTMLRVTYFEDILREKNWGPDDPHIQQWLQGSDRVRKMTLIRITDWCGLDEFRLRDITEALASDSDPEIATTAQGILDGSIAHGALWRADEE